MRDDVLVVGAGPTGLILALCLTKLGVRVRIIDTTAGPGTTSRAMLVQARTLELYQQLNLADAVIDQGHKVDAINVWADAEHRARIPASNHPRLSRSSEAPLRRAVLPSASIATTS